MKRETECYLCGQVAEEIEADTSFYHVDCNSCGTYKITQEAAEEIEKSESKCRTDICRKIQSWMREKKGRTIDANVIRNMFE